MKRKIHNALLWIQVTKCILTFLSTDSFLRQLETQAILCSAVVLLIMSAKKMTFHFLGLKSFAALTLVKKRKVTLSHTDSKR